MQDVATATNGNRWRRLALPAVAVALGLGIVVWLSWPTGEPGRGGPARDTEAADAKVDALVARSNELAGQFGQLILRFPDIDRTQPDELRLLTIALDEAARQQVAVIDQLSKVRPESLSPAKASQLAAVLEAAGKLRATMAAMTDTLQQKLADPPKPADKAKAP